MLHFPHPPLTPRPSTLTPHPSPAVSTDNGIDIHHAAGYIISNRYFSGFSHPAGSRLNEPNFRQPT